MTAGIVTATGVEAFVAALESLGTDPDIVSGLVTYNVTPVAGALATQAVRTGVNVEEVAPWPAAPPHWIHVAAEVQFASTNSRPSPMPGWIAHSRDIAGWGMAQVPVAAWLAHVRGVLGGAQ